jgi:acyl dehydratase
MSDDIKDDTHDELLKAVINYIRWNERFERFGYKGSAIQARNFLSDMRRIAQKRYQEIQAKKIEIHGNQKDQAEEASDDN